MRTGSGPWLAWVLTGLSLLAAPAANAESSTAERRVRRLDLGIYGRPTPVTYLINAPRFESSIEVLGQMPRDLNVTMAVWWQHWDLSTGSIYGKGINFQNQGCPTCVNVLPLVEQVVKKIKGK